MNIQLQTPQLNEIEKSAAEWFINRFLPSETTKNFCRAYNGLIDRERKIDKRTIEANARYQIRFSLVVRESKLQRVIVRCMSIESLWASGFIYINDDGLFVSIWYQSAVEEGIGFSQLAFLDNATELE